MIQPVVIVFFILRVTVSAAQWTPINDQGNRLRDEGRCRDAIPVLARAQSVAITELGAKHPTTAIPTNNLATAYLCVGEFSRAERFFREALAILGEDQPEMRAGILNNLGVLLMRLPGMRGSEQVLRDALALNETVYGASHSATAIPLTSLGVLRIHEGNYTSAREIFRRAVAILEGSLGEHLDTAAALNNLAVAHLYLREYPEARDHTARALQIRRQLLPARHPDIAQALYNHAVALDKLGQRKPARTAFREASSIRVAYEVENVLGLTVDVKALKRR